MRLIHTNRYFDSALALTVSSEDSEFPKENYRDHARSRIHRTLGYFVITAGTNDDIDFNEGGGALVATVAPGSYTSPTLLAAAIKTALEAAGAETYTVSFAPATGKWTISHAGATLNMQWATGPNIATSIKTAIGFTADDSGATTYTGDNVALHTEEWVVLDLGSALAVDSFCGFFEAKPTVTNPFSTTATIRLQANATDVWTAPSIDEVLTPDADFPMLTHFFSADQSFRYWRFFIQDSDNSKLVIDMPKLVLGKADFTESPEVGFPDSSNDGSVRKSTAFGNEFYDQYPHRRAFTLEWKHLLEADVTVYRKLFRDVGIVQPIVIALDHDESCFSNREEYTTYCRFSRSPVVTHSFFTLFSFQGAFREAI